MFFFVEEYSYSSSVSWCIVCGKTDSSQGNSKRGEVMFNFYSLRTLDDQLTTTEYQPKSKHNLHQVLKKISRDVPDL